MNDRRKVLELFEEQEAYTNERVSNGIEHYRKGNGKIKVLGKDGKPLKNVKIKLCQKSHQFRFGANIFMLDQFENSEKNEKYEKYFSELFNMATLPFYWDATEPEMYKTRYGKDSPNIYRRPAIDPCMEFCEKHGIEPREHALAYEAFFPDWLSNADISEIKKHYERRCREISQRYGDRIPTIEVTNEMEWHTYKTEFYNDPDFIKFCFDTAEKYFPENELVINEHTELCWGDCCRTTDKYYSYIEANMLKGVKIDAVGMQYHVFTKRENEYEVSRTRYNPRSLYGHMDMYARLGTPLQITEVTVPAYSWDKEDEEIQAEIVENLYSIWFSHLAVEQIVYWNLVDGYCYCKNAEGNTIGNMTVGENYYHGGLLRFDLSPKPAYYKIKELLEKRWHTEEEIVADENGVAEFRGFYGSYDIELDCDGKKINTELELSKNGENNFNIKF